MYDVIYIDSHGDRDARRAAPGRPQGRRRGRQAAAAERGVGRMVLPGSSKLPELRLRRPRVAARSRVASARDPLACRVHADRSGRWRTHGLGHRRGVRPRGRRRHGGRGGRRRAPSARRRGSRSRWTAACARASSPASERAAAGERLAYSTRARRPRGRRRRDRGDRRERGRQARAVPAPGRRAARRRVPRLQHLVGADHEARRRHVEARARARPALLQPRAGAAARRGRALDHDRRRGARPRAQLRARTRSARSASTPRTAPASSSTRCSSRTCCRRSGCTSPASRPRRTSTRG